MKGLLTFLFIGWLQQATVLGRHHHPKHHAVHKRSALRALKTSVMTLVDDVAKETASVQGEHDRKLKILSQSGEMYPEHKDAMTKRKTVPNLTNKLTSTTTDNDDKKFKIAGKDDSAEADSDNDDQGDDDDSGSGTDENDDQSDDEANTGDDKQEDDDTTTAEDKKPADKRQCRKRCKMPLTFHQCAFPRCVQKLGTIKDLCFFLCKNQKEKCQRVCD